MAWKTIKECAGYVLLENYETGERVVKCPQAAGKSTPPKTEEWNAFLLEATQEPNKPKPKHGQA